MAERPTREFPDHARHTSDDYQGIAFTICAQVLDRNVDATAIIERALRNAAFNASATLEAECAALRAQLEQSCYVCGGPIKEGVIAELRTRVGDYERRLGEMNDRANEIAQERDTLRAQLAAAERKYAEMLNEREQARTAFGRVADRLAEAKLVIAARESASVRAFHEAFGVALGGSWDKPDRRELRRSLIAAAMALRFIEDVCDAD